MPTPPRSSTKAHSAGYAPHDIFGSQNRCHFAATLTRIFASNAICGVKPSETTGLQFSRRDTRDRYLARRQPDAEALRRESSRAKRHARRGPRADGDHDGAASWRRITTAVAQLANKVPPGPVH